MFVPILTDMFKHWFAQGPILGSITMGGIALLKKCRRYVWEALDDYRPITKHRVIDFGPVLANRLQFVISDLIGPSQNYAMKD